MLISEIVVPDRYEALERRAGENLKEIVENVPQALAAIDAILRRTKTAGRGAFLVLRGDSGSGKSTFLHTIKFFKQDVDSISVPSSASIRAFLENDKNEAAHRIFVLEEREAAVSFSDVELETWLHEINGFIRTAQGHNALIVWPCNTDDLYTRIIALATKIGGKSLIGPDLAGLRFYGPDQSRFATIAEKTLALANQSASIADLGLTRAQIEDCASRNILIGDFFSDLHGVIESLQTEVAALVDKEQCRLWIMVVSGDEPASDVAGLTRGAAAAIDTERLLAATRANIVAELKNYPDKIDIVGTMLDAKIMHLPVLAASALARTFASPTLQVRMRAKNLSLTPVKEEDAKQRLRQSEIGLLLRDETLGVMQSGSRTGSKSKQAFKGLSEIASNNDRELNECIGRGLQAAGLIDSFETEVDFGNGMVRRTDLLCHTPTGRIRVEVMWRWKTSRAEIANYTLTKVHNYAKAIGFIKQVGPGVQ